MKTITNVDQLIYVLHHKRPRLFAAMLVWAVLAIVLCVVGLLVENGYVMLGAFAAFGMATLNADRLDRVEQKLRELED